MPARTATDVPNNFKYTPYVKATDAGLLVFAVSWLLVIGLLNIFYAISVIADAEIFIKDAAWLVGDVRPWGWLMLVVGLVQLAAVPALVMGRGWATAVGIVSVIANMVAQVMFISDFAAMAIILLIVDLGVIHALLVTRGGMAENFYG